MIQLEIIHKACVELKYQSTYNMIFDVRKCLNSLDKLIRTNFDHREKILEVADEIEKSIQDLNLSNKEIFTMQQAKPENVDRLKKEQEIMNRREMT